MPTTPPPPPPIPATTTIRQVVDALDTVIDWSIEASSRLGYFAALYKRVTIAVGVAVDEGKFEDGARLVTGGHRLDSGPHAHGSTPLSPTATSTH